MAHEIQPLHVPHEQLRTEAPSRRQQTDKYVSAFVSGSATVDMSFRNPILQKSADHFKVGIDELTVNLGNLSMLEYGTDEVLFRVLRRGRNDEQETHLTFRMHDGPPPAVNLEHWRNAFEFKVDRPYLTILEILSRCEEISLAVSSYIREEGLVQPGAGNDPIWTYTVAAGHDEGDEEHHMRIDVTTNGQLRFSGNRLFWANFTIQVPVQKYRQIFFKDVDQEYISLHPGTGKEIRPYDSFQNEYDDAIAAGNAVLAAQYHVLIGQKALHNFVLDPAWDEEVGQPYILGLVFVGDGNLLNTLDRRVTLEVGCSLPVKNSPLVDHGFEAPDFVLGRYMFHQPYEMTGTHESTEIRVPNLGTITVQGPRDRVVYHHLQPQQKIQILRLKLWARVRTYDNVSREWGMKTIVCPVEDIDYWHVRLHFLEK